MQFNLLLKHGNRDMLSWIICWNATKLFDTIYLSTFDKWTSKQQKSIILNLVINRICRHSVIWLNIHTDMWNNHSKLEVDFEQQIKHKPGFLQHRSVLFYTHLSCIYSIIHNFKSILKYLSRNTSMRMVLIFLNSCVVNALKRFTCLAF